MEELNSTTSRRLTPIESMQRLEKACYASDVRLKIRLDQCARSRLILGGLMSVPVGIYLIYNTYAPNGVLQNFKATNGAYGQQMQNFLGPMKSYQQIYRPEIAMKEKSLSLHAYSKKIQALKKEGSESITEGVHYPTSWH